MGFLIKNQLFPHSFPAVLGILCAVVIFIGYEMDSYANLVGLSGLVGSAKDSIVYLNDRLDYHGDVLREVNKRTKGIAEAQAQGTLQGPIAGAETGHLGVGTAQAGTALPRTFGGQTSRAAYPTKLERDYTVALRRYYDDRLGPRDAEVDWEDRSYAYAPQAALGYQTAGNSAMANPNWELPVAQSANQAGYHNALASNQAALGSALFGVRDYSNTGVDVASNEQTRSTGIRSIQEG